MRSSHHTLFSTAAAILVFAGAHLKGQTSPAVIGAVLRPGIDSSTGELSPEVRRHVSRGDALIAKRRYVDGEQEFRQAIWTARRQGHLASFTSWRLASAFYYEGRPADAARALDELAADAAGFGDLGIEAHALFNAAWLYGEGHNGIAASARIAKLKKLLQSPYMPVSVRNPLVERLAAPAVVTVR